LIPDPDAIIESFYGEIDLLLASLPSEPQAKPAAAGKKPPERKDDLTQIHGMSPEAATLLNQQGIFNFDQLGKSNVLTLQRMLEEAGAPESNLDPGNWPAQARYLSNIQE